MADPFCPTCGYLVDPALPQCRCRAPAPAFVVTAGTYGGALRRAVLSFKYKGQRAGAPALAALMAPQLGNIIKPDHLIVPMALHPRRQRERGYNQSVLLARALARHYDMETGERALRRTRYTERQVSLTNRAARRRNVQGAFAADPAICAGRTVMLVDDVCTTGATLSAAARALQAAGARQVYAAVLARATPGQDR